MAYNDEALKAKLSTLNETQDSIVSVSQWITFHRRHADRIASFWLTRLRDSPPPRRLNYIYLVNDIVQNARARKRSEFPDAFSPLMPEACQTAYRSSGPDIQSKIRRVVEVWRTRTVFESGILTAIEARLDDVDREKSSSGSKKLGGSLFQSSSSSGMPKELESLSPLQIALTKANLAARPAIDAAQVEYTKLTDPDTPLPTPPVHAARLSSLVKSLATAESSVAASIAARKTLVGDLERLLELNKAALAKDEETYLDLSSRRTSTEAKKGEVEDQIMRGFEAETADQFRGGDERPDVEALTPEPDPEVEGSFTETTAPTRNSALASVLAGFDSSQSNGHGHDGDDNDGSITSAAQSLSMPTIRARSASGDAMNGSLKRRKLSHSTGEDVPDLGEMGVDASEFDTGSASSVPGLDGFGGEAETATAATGVGYPATGADIVGNLDQDVDDLIRQGMAQQS